MKSKLPFKKPPELVALEPKIANLLLKYKLDRYFSVEDLELMIYECPPNQEFEVFAPVLKHLKTPRAYEEVITTLHNELWNTTPLKMLGGKSPLEMLKTRRGSLRRKAQDWLRISEVLLGIQGEFQQRVYEELEPYPNDWQEEILNDIHFLFARFYYSALREGENSGSFSDLVNKKIEEEAIEFPPDSQLTLRLFRSPVKSADPRRRIRMIMGLENFASFPLIADFFSGSMTNYARDEFYQRLYRRLAKTSPGNPLAIFKLIFRTIVESWRKENKIIEENFSPGQWQSLWQTVWYKAVGDWVETDNVFNAIFNYLGKKGIDLYFVRKNINALRGNCYLPTTEREFLQQKFMFELGKQYATYFIFPLNIYFPVLEIYYYTPFNLEKEIRDYLGLSRERKFSQWLACPPSQIRARPLAKNLFGKKF